MVITANRFHDLLGKALKQGLKELDNAVDLYLWARDHLRQLHKIDPNYTQYQTVIKIRQAFRVDPTQYLRIAQRLGGGIEPHQIETGRRLIQRFGLLRGKTQTDFLAAKR